MARRRRAKDHRACDACYVPRAARSTRTLDGEIATLSCTFLKAALVSCALTVAPCDTLAVALGESFKLGVGQTQNLDDSEFSITFTGVEYDGRCPVGATCIWQGDAAAQFEVKDDASSQSITVHSIGSEHLPRHVKVLGRTVSMFSLTPYPRENQKTNVDEYVAHMSISQ